MLLVYFASFRTCWVCMWSDSCQLFGAACRLMSGSVNCYVVLVFQPCSRKSSLSADQYWTLDDRSTVLVVLVFVN